MTKTFAFLRVFAALRGPVFSRPLSLRGLRVERFGAAVGEYCRGFLSIGLEMDPCVRKDDFWG